MTDTNYYLKALAPEHDERMEAFALFTRQEMEKLDRQLDRPSFDGMTAREEAQWNYAKGQLDTMRLFHGMFMQAQMADEMHDERAQEDGGE